MEARSESNGTSLQDAEGSAKPCHVTLVVRVTLCKKRGGKNTILPQA